MNTHNSDLTHEIEMDTGDIRVRVENTTFKKRHGSGPEYVPSSSSNYNQNPGSFRNASSL